MTAAEAVALGERPADLVVTGGRVFVPETREFQRRDVLIADNRVAALVEDADDAIGEATRIISADGQAVLPGFVDAHTHLDVHQTFENAFHRSLAGGTTTVVTETSGLGGTFGAAGVEALLAATSYLPITVKVTVPPQPLVDTFEPARAGEGEAAALADLLADDRVVGVGEIDWIHVVGRESPVDRLHQRAREEGKRIVGHGAGCSGEKLSAFAGRVDDDHEAIDADGVVERLENGLHVVGRSGSIRDDAGAIAAAVERVDGGDISLCTDGVWPRELTGEGHMDAVLRRVIEAGVEPADAIRMATLAPARHFGLDDRGSLAPGNVADVVVVDDVRSMEVRTVVSGGEVVVERGIPTVAPRTHEYPDRFYDSVAATTGPDTFAVPVAAGREGRVRAMHHEGGLMTTETVVEPPTENGEFVAAPEDDLLKVTLLNRHPGNGGGFTGFITGLGIETGAAATSITWEVPGVAAVGTEGDVRRAVAHVNEMGGGWAVVRDGEVIAELPMRVGGVCADLEVEETAKLESAVEAALRSLGMDADRPMLALETLTFPGVPELKLSFSGYAHITDREVVGLAPEE